MSTIVLSPNASGTGAFTIAAPNSNSNRTLTLPDETGTVTTSASTPTFTGAATAPAFIPNSSSVPTNGLYLPATNTPAWASNSTKVVSVIKGSSLALEGTTPQTGTGITFPATQSASSEANTLDDYEEGSWTPTIYGTTSAGTGTYAQQIGKYTKIGNVVMVTADIQCSSHTGTGNFGLGGLPFTTANLYCSAALGSFTNLTVPASNYPTIRFENSSTNAYLLATPVGGGSSALMALDGSCNLTYQLTYNV